MPTNEHRVGGHARNPGPWAIHPTITHPTSPHYPGALALRHNGRHPTRPLTILGLLMKRTFRYFDGALGGRWWGADGCC
jgi:hypothetical protein